MFLRLPLSLITTHAFRSVKVLKLKKFKKDATLKLFKNGMSMSVQKSQVHKVAKLQMACIIWNSSRPSTSNENAVCAECGTCVKPKRKANKSVATPHKKIVASDTTIQKSKSYYKKLYENTNQEWKWWIAKRCPSGYTWTQKPLRTKKIWMPKIRKDDESTSISPTIDIVSRITNIVQLILFIVDSGCTKHMTGNLKLLCNFVEKFLGTVRFGNDQFAPILGYGDLIQGNDAPFLNVQKTFEQRSSSLVLHQMMSDHNSSDLAPQRQEMSIENVSSGLVPQGQKASDYDNSDPVPPRQNVEYLFKKQLHQLQSVSWLKLHQLKHGYGIEDFLILTSITSPYSQRKML
ncbi:hypothetical protein Tco_0163454 [Tanacetum coccineum]